MDKYDMKISMEQIQTLVEKKKYKQASDLAKTLNWHKVKDWPSLSAAITAHEKVGELEEARDMATIAFEAEGLFDYVFDNWGCPDCEY